VKKMHKSKHRVWVEFELFGVKRTELLSFEIVERIDAEANG